MKIAALITARLKSTRLPLKAMHPLGGKPLIAHLIDRLKTARLPERIVVCTSPLEQDNPLEEIAKREGVECFRGDPTDVLRRLTDAAKAFGVDTVVNCTADNPFVDPEFVDKLVEFHLAHNHDYSRIEGLPLGTTGWLLRTAAMVRACEIKDEVDTEVWGGYFTDSGLFSWGTLSVNDPEVRWPELRLTVDTPEDLELAARICGELDRPGRIFTLREITSLCRRRPDLVAINASVRQKPSIPIRLRKKPIEP